MSGPVPVRLPVTTRSHTEFVNITADVKAAIPSAFTGICLVFCQHTTAALTINENADPDVVHDLLLELERLVPWRNAQFRHNEGNSAAHLKSSMLGVSAMVPVQDGRLVLGTWQGIFFCEFDGPRARHVVVQFLGST